MIPENEEAALELYSLSLDALKNKKCIYNIYPIILADYHSTRNNILTYSEPDSLYLVNDKLKETINGLNNYGLLDDDDNCCCDAGSEKIFLSFKYVARFLLNTDSIPNIEIEPTGQFVFNIYENEDRTNEILNYQEGELVYETVCVRPAYRYYNIADISDLRFVFLSYNYSITALNNMQSFIGQVFGTDIQNKTIFLRPKDLLLATLINSNNYSENISLLLSNKKVLDPRLNNNQNNCECCCPLRRS